MPEALSVVLPSVSVVPEHRETSEEVVSFTIGNMGQGVKDADVFLDINAMGGWKGAGATQEGKSSRGNRSGRRRRKEG